MRTICESELGDDSSRVEIVCFDGLVVDFAEERKVNFLVRGLRAFSGAHCVLAPSRGRPGGVSVFFLVHRL